MRVKYPQIKNKTKQRKQDSEDVSKELLATITLKALPLKESKALLT